MSFWTSLGADDFAGGEPLHFDCEQAALAVACRTEGDGMTMVVRRTVLDSCQTETWCMSVPPPMHPCAHLGGGYSAPSVDLILRYERGEVAFERVQQQQQQPPRRHQAMAAPGSQGGVVSTPPYKTGQHVGWLDVPDELRLQILALVLRSQRWVGDDDGQLEDFLRTALLLLRCKRGWSSAAERRRARRCVGPPTIPRRMQEQLVCDLMPQLRQELRLDFRSISALAMALGVRRHWGLGTPAARIVSAAAPHASLIHVRGIRPPVPNCGGTELDLFLRCVDAIARERTRRRKGLHHATVVLEFDDPSAVPCFCWQFDKLAHARGGEFGRRRIRDGFVARGDDAPVRVVLRFTGDASLDWFADHWAMHARAHGEGEVMGEVRRWIDKWAGRNCWEVVARRSPEFELDVMVRDRLLP